jgi:dTDP-4-amino-4,6-dideoxygalactose transaminase
MSKIKRLIHLFSPNSIHFIQPYWKKKQWDIVFNIFNANYPEKFLDSPVLLENDLANLSGLKFGQSFNLGRSAIQIALESYRFPAKSEVILPSFSCAGVITPVLSAGLTPVLVDIDQDFNILASSVHEALSPRTQAIILPHLSGKLAQGFFEILELARKNNLKTIVDASQALGLKVNDKLVVNYGDVGIFSFNGGKLFPSSGGGLLVTDDEQVISYCMSKPIPSSNIAESNKRIFQFILKRGMHRVTFPVFSLINSGHNIAKAKYFTKRKDSENGSFNIERINPIEAALAQTQIEFVPEIIRKRQQNAYQIISSNVLQDLGFQIPDIPDNIFTKFLVTHENPEISYHVRKVLIQNGIETEQSYTPLSLRDLSKAARKIATPNTDKFWKGAFSIPINPLLNSEDIERIIYVLRNQTT